MRTITKNIYKFDELKDDAKENAITDYRYNGFEYFWGNENEKTLKEFESIFPIKIGNWQYGGYNSFINFKFTEYDVEEIKGLRLMKYIYNNYGYILFKGEYKGNITNKVNHPRIKSTKLSNGKWFNAYYSKVFKSDSCVLTGYCIDDDILDPIYDFLKNPKENITFYDLIQKCLNSWIKACNADYEYQLSDEAISEHFEANEYEFDEEGNRI